MSLSERIKSLIKKESTRNFANRSGVKDSTLRSVLNGTRPSIDFVVAIATASNVNIEWLATGLGDKEKSDTTSTANDSALQFSGFNSPQAPISGLASCGPDGWSRLETTQFQAELPKSIQHDANAFAVISRGESMQPFGIYEGYLCFCSPATELKVGDIACIERKGENDEISLTIKKLGIIGHDAVELIGYLPLEEKPTQNLHAVQYQELFWETVRMKEIEQLSVVTHIHTRPSAY